MFRLQTMNLVIRVVLMKVVVVMVVVGTFIGIWNRIGIVVEKVVDRVGKVDKIVEKVEFVG